MPLDPLTAGLELGGDFLNGGIQIATELLTSTQTRRLDAANQQANDDVKNFKDALLGRDLESVNLRLAGLRNGVLVNLTDADSEQLKSIVPNLDGFALLGLYCRARSADLAYECSQIIRDTASTVNSK
jgi:hypothetical protein